MHTQGEWFADGRAIVGAGTSIDVDGHTIAMIHSAMTAGRFSRHIDEKTMEANKALIVAAPKLLVACELALKAFEENWAIDWDELRDAIEAAKGIK